MTYSSVHNRVFSEKDHFSWSGNHNLLVLVDSANNFLIRTNRRLLIEFELIFDVISQRLDAFDNRTARPLVTGSSELLGTLNRPSFFVRLVQSGVT